jgi:GNAT superfamily N-acetyltransferase
MTSATEAAVTVASRAAPAGVLIRALHRQEDLAAAEEVFDAARRHDGIPYVKTADGLASDFRALGPRSGGLVAEVDRQVVAWVRMFDFGVSRDVGRLLSHGGHVHPDWRGRGIGRALLDGAQAHLRRLESLKPTPAGTAIGFETGVAPTATRTVAMLTHAGYGPARYYIEMVRDTLDDPPPTELPAGIEFRPALPEHRPQIARAINEAFRDHRAWPDFNESQMVQSLQHPLRGQLDIWQVAWERDEVVGGVLGYIDEAENKAFGRKRGYTEQIFTRRPWRGRGIASALIGRNLRVLRERGMTEAGLSVDTENPSGALRLYERLGFREDARMVTYRHELRVAAAAR